MQYSELAHTRRKLPQGGRVVVLDTGALITPEAAAMLQALHSRSVGGIDAHLEKLAKKGAADFMNTYYVGYGDKSIGDCGTTTIFIEGVSMLAAKAIQSFPLYSGQESSTRYIDYSKQRFISPHTSEKLRQLQESLRDFYLQGLEDMKLELARRHPRQEGEDEKVWEKAVRARAFDIMRSFLPAGAATNLAWHTNLRQAADHIARLRNHPLLEVREIADACEGALREAHPSSFTHKRHETTEEYTKEWMRAMHYFDFSPRKTAPSAVRLDKNGIDTELLKTYRHVLAKRPVKTEPPKFLAECGTMRFSFFLDFGSYRDLQRHRALTQRMPLLTTHWGFEEWYFEQMTEDLRLRAKKFLREYTRRLSSLSLDPFVAQYYIPMGYRVAVRLAGDLPALIWMVELRSGIAVHPTLRKVAQEMGGMLRKKFGASHGLVLYLDVGPDRFNYKRGTHDIVEKSVR